MCAVSNGLYSNLNTDGSVFKGNNMYNYQVKKRPDARRIGTCVASALCPGLGQVINNETPKGIAFFLGFLCDYLLLIRRGSHNFLGKLIGIGISIWSAIDAYKRA